MCNHCKQLPCCSYLIFTCITNLFKYVSKEQRKQLIYTKYNTVALKVHSGQRVSFLGRAFPRCPRPLLLRLSRFVSQVLVLTFGDRYTFQKLLLLFSSQLWLIICFYASFIEIIIELYEWALQLLLHGLCSFKREKKR